MNLIFIGANGAGKTTLANHYYKKGYHQLKISPLATNLDVSLAVTLSDLNLVLDRWSVVDVAIYRANYELLNRLPVPIFNKNNLIFYLENKNLLTYDESSDDSRVIQRPAINSLAALEERYRNIVIDLEAKGIKVNYITVSSITKTTNLIDNIIHNFKEEKLDGFKKE